MISIFFNGNSSLQEHERQLMWKLESKIEPKFLKEIPYVYKVVANDIELKWLEQHIKNIPFPTRANDSPYEMMWFGDIAKSIAFLVININS